MRIICSNSYRSIKRYFATHLKKRLFYLFTVLLILSISGMIVAMNPIVKYSGITVQKPKTIRSSELVFDIKYLFSLLQQDKPDIFVEKEVEPNVAKIGDRLQFTINVYNTGKGPAENMIVTDPVDQLLIINSVDSSKGTVTINPNQVKVEVGTMDPDQTITIKIFATVSPKSTFNIQVFNSAYVQYTDSGKTISRTSNTVSVNVSGSETLPATGGREITVDDPSNQFQTFMMLGLTIILFGLFLLLSHAVIGNDHLTIRSWTKLAGITLVVAGTAVFLPACGLNQSLENSGNINLAPLQENLENTPVAFKQQSHTPLVTAATQVAPTQNEISSPSVKKTLDELEYQEPDMSPVTRLVIPTLNIDNGVVYTPYDGLSWQVSNLDEEIGWMENTSIPGLGSNTALSAHVTKDDGSDGPFKYLDDLKPGDHVEVHTENKIYTYTVSGQEVVSDTDFSIIEPTNQPRLTLITCTDWHIGFAAYLSRLVVYADLTDIQPVTLAVSGN